MGRCSIPAPISLDLRRRIVDAYENGEGTYREIAERFGVGEASVSRYVRLNRYCEGDLSPKNAGGDRRSVKFSPEVRRYVSSLVLDEPNWTTQELADELEEVYGLEVSRQQVGRLLHALGFTFKRGSSGHEPPRSPRIPTEEAPISSSNGTWTRPGSSSSTKSGSS